VSPKKVVVAGRVSAAAVDDDGGWLVAELCPVDVPEEPVCALTLAAAASVHTQIAATRLTIFSRLQADPSIGSIIPHGFAPRLP